MAFTHKTMQAISLKKLQEQFIQNLKDKVEKALAASGGRFVRFLDAAQRDGLVVQPRWLLDKDSPIAPIHTFHLEPLRFATDKEPIELPGVDWKWLLCRLDYPHEAKERLLELARVEALAWVNKQPPGKVSAGERRVAEALAWLFGQPFPKARLAWLTMPGYIHPCELDGFCEPLKLAFEFHGDQHYEAVERYKMDADALLQRQRTDAWKRLAVHEHQVYLVEVAHDELPTDKSVKAMAEVLLRKLNANGTARKFLGNVASPDAIALRDSLGLKG